MVTSSPYGMLVQNVNTAFPPQYSATPAAPPMATAFMLPPGLMGDGAWLCSCGNSNYARREQCNRCYLPKVLLGAPSAPPPYAPLSLHTHQPLASTGQRQLVPISNFVPTGNALPFQPPPPPPHFGAPQPPYGAQNIPMPPPSLFLPPPPPPTWELFQSRAPPTQLAAPPSVPEPPSSKRKFAENFDDPLPRTPAMVDDSSHAGRAKAAIASALAAAQGPKKSSDLMPPPPVKRG